MKLEKELKARSGSICELCAATEHLNVYAVPEAPQADARGHVLICGTCQSQYEDSSTADINHWRCLNESMWNTEPAVQVMAWRMLHRLRAESWPQDLLDMMYMEEDTQTWAKATEIMDGDEQVIHKDSNGHVLQAGDTVVLIKDLKVKGSSMIAKRGTAVRRISLDRDNANHIEGKVDGQHIVILTQYVKRQG